MTDYLIGVDAGNTMVKAALFDLEGRTLAVAARQSATLQPAPGFVERSPDELWKAAAGAIRSIFGSTTRSVLPIAIPNAVA